MHNRDMIDPKSFGFSRRAKGFIFEGPKNESAEQWMRIESEVLFECFGLKLLRSDIYEIFESFPVGTRIKQLCAESRSLFSEVFDPIYEKAYKDQELTKLKDRATLENRLGIKVKEVEVISGLGDEEPLYQLTLNGAGTFELISADLMFQNFFRLKFLKQFHRKVDPFEKQEWERLTSYWLENVKVIEPGLSKTGVLEEYINEFISQIFESDSEDEAFIRLKRGAVIKYKEGIAFRAEALRKYLDKAKITITNPRLFTYLRKKKWDSIQLGSTRDRIRCWYRINYEESKN